MSESRLLRTLREFKGAEGDEANLTSAFVSIAKAAFYSGYFLVNETSKVYITEIEFYYHEDKGLIKDNVKYHRNYGTEEFPYFPLGSLHPHKSGVDLTFENQEKGFRASFLIRGYKILDKAGNLLYSNKDGKQTRPTYLWDDLFGEASFLTGNQISLRWIDESNLNNEELLPPQTRINVNDAGSKRFWRYTKP